MIIQINRLLIQLNEESILDVVVILGVMGYLLGWLGARLSFLNVRNKHRSICVTRRL